MIRSSEGKHLSYANSYCGNTNSQNRTTTTQKANCHFDNMNGQIQLFDQGEVRQRVCPVGKKLTGYTIYNAEQKRRTQRHDLPGLYPDLPIEKYDIIYADPPWDYGGKTQFDKSSTSAEKMD